MLRVAKRFLSVLEWYKLALYISPFPKHSCSFSRCVFFEIDRNLETLVVGDRIKVRRVDNLKNNGMRSGHEKRIIIVARHLTNTGDRETSAGWNHPSLQSWIRQPGEGRQPSPQVIDHTSPYRHPIAIFGKAHSSFKYFTLWILASCSLGPQCSLLPLAAG